MGKKEQLEKAKKLFSQGMDLYQQNRFNEAIEKWKAAKPILERLKMPQGVADVKVNIGVALVELGRPAEVIGHYEAAKTIYERLKMPPRVAVVEARIGVALYALDRPAEAIGHYEAAKTIYERLKMEADVAGDERLKMEADVAGVEVGIGAALRALGRPAEAIGHYEAAKTIYERLKMPQGVADIEVNIGVALGTLGRLAEAIRHFEAARPIFERLKMPQGVAGVLMNIGNALYALGRPDEAIGHYEAARPIFERLKMPHRVANIEVDIGNALGDLGRPAEAIGHYEAARPIFERLKMPQGVADVEVGIGVALKNLGRPAEAIKKYEIALGVYEDLGFFMEQGMAYRNMGSASMDLGDFERALQDLNRSFELMERVRTWVRSPELQRSLKKQYLVVSDALCAVHLALWEREGHTEHLGEALNNVELAKCSSVAESLEAGGGGVPCPEMEKLIIEEDRLLDIAKQNYSTMLGLIKLRGDGQITRAQFRGSLADWEKEYDAIHKEIERLRSEVLVKCADVGSTPIPRTYNVLKRALEMFPREERWNILEFAISSSLEHKLIVFLVDQDGFIQCVVHDVDLGEVKDLIARCQGIVEKVRNHRRKEANRELSVLCEQLYDTLIPEEIGKALRSRDVEHLIVVAHKCLHWVPFEALFDGDSHWALKYAISTDFSLDLARLSVEKRERRVTKMGEKSLSFLLVKNPLFDLKGADEEVDGVLNLLEAQRIQYKVLEHEQATQPAFIEAANERPFSVLHYAGHALFMGKHPSLSHLYLHTDGQCPACSGKTKHHTSELFAATEIIQGVKFKGAPIVYLSGCETGVAEVEPGDEMFGLVRALMYAGATSLVLSRWLVRDVVAPVFGAEFYRQLLGGESVAVALQNARRKVFNEDPLSFTDWAVFSLQGDPFRRLA